MTRVSRGSVVVTMVLAALSGGWACKGRKAPPAPQRRLLASGAFPLLPMVVRGQDLFWAERAGVFRVDLATGRRDEIFDVHPSRFAITGDRLIWQASEGPSISIASFGSDQSTVIAEGWGALVADEREIYLVGEVVRILTADGTEGRTLAPGTRCDPAAALDARRV